MKGSLVLSWQAYELLHAMEPYIHQVLTYAQQSRERTNFEQAALSDKMAEYRRQLERSNMQSLSEVAGVTVGGDGMQMVGKSNNLIEKIMNSTPKGKVGLDGRSKCLGNRLWV